MHQDAYFGITIAFKSGSAIFTTFLEEVVPGDIKMEAPEILLNLRRRFKC